MTGKEAVKILYSERAYAYDDSNIHYDNIGRCLSIIEKDLEVLEILKYRIHLIDSKIKNDSIILEVAFVEASGFALKNSKEYDLLKEWLKYD